MKSAGWAYDLVLTSKTTESLSTEAQTCFCRYDRIRDGIGLSGILIPSRTQAAVYGDSLGKSQVLLTLILTPSRQKLHVCGGGFSKP